MNVSVTPELERLVAEKVKSGMYQTSSAVIREGLRLVRERDERLASLRGDIRVGFESIERGEFAGYDALRVQTLAAGGAGEGPKTGAR